MQDYRAEFYRAYASTHTIPRKGRLTPERLAYSAAQWDAQIGPLLPADRQVRVLDAGCGDGAVMWWLRRAGYAHVEGVEVGDDQIEIARGLDVGPVHAGDLIPFLNQHPAQYGVVILRNVLEHFEKADVLALLRAAHRALTPGGRVVMQVPNAESPFFGRIRYGDFTHGLAFSISSLSQVLAVTGFSEPDFHPVRTHFAGLRGLPRRILWRLVEAGYRGLLTAELGPGRYVVTQDILVRAEKR
jgi:2-polyprenyl-3-methyl-5-hydroxy-6-metoxy-1,4-benzoquinol methylase